MTRRAQPALLAGTSTEYLGRKPLPKVLRTRQIVTLLGPSGVGKSAVARHLAGADATVWSRHKFSAVLTAAVRNNEWPQIGDNLVVDGTGWLDNREGVVKMLAAFTQQRAQKGLKTILCEGEATALDPLIKCLGAGSLVVVALRFPIGRRSRVRTAKSICQELALPMDRVNGSVELDPWTYDEVRKWLEREVVDG